MIKNKKLYGNVTEYILMHHDNPVCVIDIESIDSILSIKIKTIIDEKRMPLPCHPLTGEARDKAFLKWAMNRVIPDYRSGVTRLFIEFGETNRFFISMRAHGVSFTDGYWYKEPNENQKWEDVNFYDNQFSYDVGNYIIHESDFINNVFSPDLTTNGRLPKIWRINPDTKKICLLKGGLAPLYVEPYNEMAASGLIEAMEIHIPYVKYEVVKIHKKAYSVCESFLSPGEEYIPASDIVHSAIKPKDMDNRQFLKKRCKELNIKDYEYFLNKMALIDYLLENTDRHLGNFGFIRDIDTLEFKRPAPIFDCGTSLWCDGSQIPEIKAKRLQKEMKQFHDVIRKMPSKRFRRNDIVNAVTESLSGANLDTDARSNERIKAIGKTIYEKITALNELKEKVKEEYEIC